MSESGIAAGVRRIEGITGTSVLEYYRKLEADLCDAAATVKATPATLSDRLSKMNAEIKSLGSELESLRSKMAKDSVGDMDSKVCDVKGLSLIATAVPSADMNALRDLADQMKEKYPKGVFILCSENDGKVNLVVMASDGAIEAGAHAGNLIKKLAPMVGGGGGGRPNMAQAGGKDPSGIDAMLAGSAAILAEML